MFLVYLYPSRYIWRNFDEMKLLLLPVTLFFSVVSYGQYYYNDIIANMQGNTQYQLLRSNHIKKVKTFSYDGNGEITEGFTIEEEISNDGQKTTLTTNIPNRPGSVLTSYFEKGRLAKSSEKKIELARHNSVETNTSYAYDEKGLLKQVSSVTADTTVDDYFMSETHLWSYNEKGKPVQMLKIKGGHDTTYISFVFDEQGNIAEEHWRKNNREMETYYYYYDASNRISDVVRFSTKIRKLVPDYLYEYDAEGRITQMTQLTNGGNNYLYGSIPINPMA
ncbi:hypothetical protein F5148DRAFT_1154619 [Russula earlei]|uniref:Uncharacterized protein n=1 Tax=Russula earlei TaxID=71964 RepID=A0ACC0TS68_9AGAM|nr:hypothetical protein F5148DRAFT_1154619 [Russula earlei]